MLACLELHTYSSLNPEFLSEYKGPLNGADKAVVFYSPNAVKIKKLEAVSSTQILKAFQREDLVVFTDPAAFQDYLFEQDFTDTSLLLMSSGNYGGLDFEKVKEILK